MISIHIATTRVCVTRSLHPNEAPIILLSFADTGDDNSTMELFRPGDKTNTASSSSPSSTGQSTFDPRWDAFSMMGAGGGGNSVGEGSNSNTNASNDPLLDPALPRGPPLTEQEIVPQLLIDFYVSMIDPSRAQTVDSDIARHCAFSLPAVALTLGRSNWPLLKDTYEALATDMQWKVRRTLASSIHELGVILGEESSGKDLIPIFNGFLKDLDEVRIGLLKHLSDFLKLLNPLDRREYLPKLSEFLKMDNDRNWRFRYELTEQLEQLIPLYSPSDVEEHIAPIAMVLVRDKVAAVRQAAAGVLSSILKSLNASDTPELAHSLFQCVVESLAHETLWVHRQTFATLCYGIHTCGAMDQDQFLEDAFPHLLEMSEDKVPNVRLAVARTLSRISAEGDPEGLIYKTDDEGQRLRTIEMNLKNDQDVDVRYFYGGTQKVYGTGECGEEGEGEDVDVMVEDAETREEEGGVNEQQQQADQETREESGDVVVVGGEREDNLNNNSEEDEDSTDVGVSPEIL